MASIDRNTLVSIHLVIACFIFPAAIMFAVTGSLYAWGFKGSYLTESHTLSWDATPTPDKNALVGRVLQELQARDLPLPTGKPKLKSAGTSWYLEWTGSNLDVILQPSAEPDSAELKIKSTTFYRHFVQLHKAKGGQLFKAYAALFALILLALLASGFTMAWQMPRYRRVAVRSAAAGVVVFAIAATLS